jgi:hypothetical protein
LGDDPVLSKMAVLQKWTSGRLKKRLILDAQETRVSLASRKQECIVLPRLADVIEDALRQRAMVPTPCSRSSLSLITIRA